MTPQLPEDLLEVLATLQAPEDVSRVLQDLMSASEIQACRERWEIVKALDEGQTQREVRDRLGVSVTTVNRGNQQLKYGAGGFRLALDVRARLAAERGA